MSLLFVAYPGCSTCQKARRFLEDNRLPFQCRSITEQTPTAAELNGWQQKSGLPLGEAT